MQNAEGYEPGQQLQFMDIFKEGDKVDIAGKSKGHGFQGAAASPACLSACNWLCARRLPLCSSQMLPPRSSGMPLLAARPIYSNRVDISSIGTS